MKKTVLLFLLSISFIRPQSSEKVLYNIGQRTLLFADESRNRKLTT